MSQKKRMSSISIIIALLAVFFTFSKTYGSGFAVYTQGGSSLGQGAATIAHTDDPSAIFFNPALINKLEGTQTEIGTTLIFPERKFKSDVTGRTFKAESDVLYPSTFFITHKFNDKISVGLGVFNPFGLRNKWGDDWEGKYITTNAEMQTFNINPAVSYQISPNMSFAAGLDFLLLDTILERKLNLGIVMPGLPDGNWKFDGDGNGIGYNFGILIEPHKDISIGLSYRSEIKVGIEGNNIFALPDPSLGAIFPNTPGNADLTLPQQVHAGIYYKGLYPLTFEVALRWEGWSSFDQLKLKFDKLVRGDSEYIERKDWKDTYSANIGAKYQLNDSVALLAGYLYGGNPIPDRTFEPMIPDANTHLICVGTDVKYKKFRFDLSYAYQHLQSRHKNNPVDDLNDSVLNPATSANGKYNSDLHMVGLSLTYQF